MTRRHFPFRLLISFIVFAAFTNAESAIFWISGPVAPGETVLVTGQFRISSSMSIRVANLGGSGTDWHGTVADAGVAVPVLKRTEHVVMFVLPDLGGDGVYGFRVDQQNEAPQYGRVNLPEIWWTLSEPAELSHGVDPDKNLRDVSGGTALRIFGRCLTHAGHADNVHLTSSSGESILTEVTALSPYSLSVELPAGLAPGPYSVTVSATPRGTEGSGAAFAVQTDNNRPGDFNELNLKSFGVIGDGKFDNSPIFAAASIKAAALGKTIVRVPSGLYFLSKPLDIPPGVYFVGESQENTAIYFPDVDPAPHAWISGTHHFGLTNMSIYCGNQNAILSSDMSGDPSKSGHIRLERVRIRGNSFRGHISHAVAAARSSKLMEAGANGVETVRLSGPDLLVQDCDFMGSGKVLLLFHATGSVVRRNHLVNGRSGWYSVEGSDGLVFENNQVEGGDLTASGGSYSVNRGATRSRNVYTANNRYSKIQGNDAEAFTSDGGGGAYYGAVASIEGRSVTLKADPKWLDLNWQGTLMAITSGRGLGQWRSIENWAGRNVGISAPFDIAPDATSTVTIVPLALHYIFYKNHFSDSGVAIQFFGTGVEHIVAENELAHAGGIRVDARPYFDGVEPEIDVQVLHNSISGFGYSIQSDGRPCIIHSVLSARAGSPAAVIGLIMRNNELKDNTALQISSWGRAGMKAILLEGNHLTDAVNDLQIDNSVASEIVVR